jgi:hypothetical protein
MLLHHTVGGPIETNRAVTGVLNDVSATTCSVPARNPAPIKLALIGLLNLMET